MFTVSQSHHHHHHYLSCLSSGRIGPLTSLLQSTLSLTLATASFQMARPIFCLPPSTVSPPCLPWLSSTPVSCTQVRAMSGFCSVIYTQYMPYPAPPSRVLDINYNILYNMARNYSKPCQYCFFIIYICSLKYSKTFQQNSRAVVKSSRTFQGEFNSFFFRFQEHFIKEFCNFSSLSRSV